MAFRAMGWRSGTLSFEICLKSSRGEKEGEMEHAPIKYVTRCTNQDLRLNQR